jgi:hypothetical protein
VRIGQPKEEKVTWPRLFVSLLRETYPAYNLNKLARGTRTECLCRVENGLLYSQNTCCHRGEYNHCFGVALSPALSDPCLDSPFFAGSRFDHNSTIFDAVTSELGLQRADWPPGLHSTHQLRTGAEDIVRRCTANAQRYLAPFYCAMARRAKQALGELVDVLRCKAEDLDDPAFIAAHARDRHLCLNFSMATLADPPTEWWALGAPRRYEALLAAVPDLFKRQVPYLEEVAAVVEQL